jgi:hypothetical protein
MSPARPALWPRRPAGARRRSGLPCPPGRAPAAEASSGARPRRLRRGPLRPAAPARSLKPVFPRFFSAGIPRGSPPAPSAFSCALSCAGNLGLSRAAFRRGFPRSGPVRFFSPRFPCFPEPRTFCLTPMACFLFRVDRGPAARRRPPACRSPFPCPLLSRKGFRIPPALTPVSPLAVPEPPVSWEGDVSSGPRRHQGPGRPRTGGASLLRLCGPGRPPRGSPAAGGQGRPRDAP